VKITKIKHWSKISVLFGNSFVINGQLFFGNDDFRYLPRKRVSFFQVDASDGQSGHPFFRIDRSFILDQLQKFGAQAIHELLKNRASILSTVYSMV